MSSETRHAVRAVSSASTRKDVASDEVEEEVLLDPMSIESKISKSLDPEVNQEEVDEYIRSVSTRWEGKRKIRSIADSALSFVQ